MSYQKADATESPAKRAVMELRKLEGNDMCADCGKEDPDWADVQLGVFICIECSGIHRSLGSHLTKVKSIQLDQWTDENIQQMAEIGNNRAKDMWEATVPVCWRKPTPNDSLACREQWIKAKYARKEFTDEKTDKDRPYTTGIKKGFLFKKKKIDNVWQSRYFVLTNHSLSYFKKLNSTSGLRQAHV